MHDARACDASRTRAHNDNDDAQRNDNNMINDAIHIQHARAIVAMCDEIIAIIDAIETRERDDDDDATRDEFVTMREIAQRILSM